MDATNLKVYVIPHNSQAANLKILSINQCNSTSLNGFKQFELSMSQKTPQQTKVQNLHFNSLICDLTQYLSNINYITAISLRNCQLNYIPNEMHILPLKELDLMHNLLDHVPECLYLGLNQIEILNLAQNPISNFNIAPKCVHSLRILHLEDCKFTDVPYWLQNVSSKCLEELYFSRNYQRSLKRTDSPQLSAKLRKFVFNTAKITQEMLEFFKSFNLLQYLDIGNTYETGVSTQKKFNVIPDINALITNCLWFRHIKILKFNNLYITELSEEFGKLINLEELHLKHNLLMNIPENICTLKNLVLLDISHNCIYSLPNLSSMQKLEEIHAAKNHLSKISLMNMSRLKYVDLFDNDLESVEISAANVEYIDVEQNSIDANILLNGRVDNYEERRDSLRLRRRSQIGNGVAFEWRAIGRKLGIFELDSPTDILRNIGESKEEESRGRLYDEGSYDYNSDNDDEGLGDRDSEGGTNKIEDAEWNSGDDCSDWGDSGVNDMVTLSDAEFLPEEELNSSALNTNNVKLNHIEIQEFEELFIDAD